MDSFDRTIRMLSTGRISVDEAEKDLAKQIRAMTERIEDIDERVETHRQLKRRAWTALLKATK